MSDPRVPITDPRFVYTSSSKTDLRKTFARIRREQRRQEQLAQPIKLMTRKK